MPETPAPNQPDQPCDVGPHPEEQAGVRVEDGWEVIPCPQGHPGQTCLEHERYLDALENGAPGNGFDIDPDSGDGGDYDKALDAHDRQQDNDGSQP